MEYDANNPAPALPEVIAGMFPVSETDPSASGRAHEVRSGCGCPPVIAQCAYQESPRWAIRAILLVALALCLALPGLSWAAMPIDESPAGSLNSPRAIQAVTWSNFAPADWVTALPVTCSVTAVSDVGFESGSTTYSISQNGGADWSAWSDSGLSTSNPDLFTNIVTVTGLSLGDSATQNQIRFRMYETYETGNLAVFSPSYTVKVDATPPAAPQELTATPAGWTNAASFSVQWTNPPDLTGIAGAWYKLDAAPTSATDGIFVATLTSISGITPAANGVHPIYVWLQDAFGRRDHNNASSSTLYRDTIAPESTAIPTPPLPTSGWYMSGVDFRFEVTDLPVDPNFPAQVYASLDGGLWLPHTELNVTTEGSHSLSYQARDKANNLDPISTILFGIDMTPPTVSLTPDRAPNASGWYTATVAYTLTVSDGASGPAQGHYRLNGGAWQTGTGFTLAVDGIYTIEAYGEDAAGNQSGFVTAGAQVDTTAPAAPAGITVDPTGWTDGTFDVTWTSPGDLSGVDGAYYKLGAAPTGPQDGTFVAGTGPIVDLTMPVEAGEGEYRLYLWLRDVAGNADHTTASAESPQLRYDPTPPNVEASLDGSLGSDGWYRSPVVATLVATDGASGVSALHHRVGEGSEWQSTPNSEVTLHFWDSGVYSLQFYAEDVLGNLGTVTTRLVNVDFSVPVPTQVNVLPPNGSADNSFRLEWPPIADLSGVAGAYVRFGEPPSGPTDGTYYAGVDGVDGVTAPGEGRHTAYVWLIDAAGNVDHSTAVVLVDSVCWDLTPPVTQITSSVPSGLDGWYVEPVTFAMSATDAASGVREVQYRVDDGPWVPALTLVFGEDGLHEIEIRAVDNAGNVEDAHVYAVSIDRTPPQAVFEQLKSPQSSTSIELIWSGTDGEDGSGIASYDVEVRDGYNAGWQQWLRRTSLTTATYTGQRGHTYFFQVFARDRAGNRRPVGDATRVLIQSVLNGEFDAGNFSNWFVSDALWKTVEWTPGPYGWDTKAAHLGSVLYGPNFEDPGELAIDSGTISQVIAIPPLSQVRWPTLTFWYRVKTYDIIYSEVWQQCADTFDVKLCVVGQHCTVQNDGEELALLLRDGNPMSSAEWNKYEGPPPLYDTNWKLAVIDLRPYAGQTLQLVFANEMRIDHKYNTWSYVDEVRIIDRNRLYIPLIRSSAGVTAAASEPVEMAQPPEPAGLPDLDRSELIR